MRSLSRAARRIALAPSLAEVRFAARGFPVPPSPTSAALEAVPQTVVVGFEWGMEATDQRELRRRIELLAPELHGFGYEGAMMAAVVRDAMTGFRSRRAAALLAGPARPHLFLTYIGIGFAMARLPRLLWRSVLPELDGVPHHPTVSWLAVDGYAFDRAYFDTETWVAGRRRFTPYPWQGRPDYFRRACDQGVGRALWFVYGAQPGEVAVAVSRFEPDRHPDLWAGVGLAAAFAGGADAGGLARLRSAAGDHRAQLGLGSVLAAKARDFSGIVPGHTGLATRELAGLDVAGAVALADDTEPAAVPADSAPAYELWRSAIRDRLAASAEFPRAA